MKSGYIIANQNEEFLAIAETTPTHDLLAWTPDPGLAKVFSSSSKCRKVMRAIASAKYRLWELTIAETERQYIVGFTGDNRPPWF